LLDQRVECLGVPEGRHVPCAVVQFSSAPQAAACMRRCPERATWTSASTSLAGRPLRRASSPS